MGTERVLDDRTYFHYYATGITPAMTKPAVGKESALRCSRQRLEREYLDGGKTTGSHYQNRFRPKTSGRSSSTPVSTARSGDRPEDRRRRQQKPRYQCQRRRFLYRLVWPRSPQGSGRQLGADDSGRATTYFYGYMAPWNRGSTDLEARRFQTRRIMRAQQTTGF